MSVDAVAEMVLREVLVSALGMQTLDRYVSAALRQISMLNGRLDNQALTRMMNYDPERLVSPIHRPKPGTDDQMTLGFKGLGLKQMAAYGHSVPEGFVLSTELFGAMPAMSYPPLYDDTIQRVQKALDALWSGRRGCASATRDRLLLLSIRSGAAISMPGLMTTFVNVGLNDELAEALARQAGLDWAAWDSYRRFLQSWAMSYGIDRDFFDAIMTEFKARYGVERRSSTSRAEQMREIAFAYKSRARDHGRRVRRRPLRPGRRLHPQGARVLGLGGGALYRQYIGVAEEWGTAVVVQRMVFGNLSRESGSGVTFTNNPLEPHSRQVRLFGDFAVRSQGEDLVGGLVFPLAHLGGPAPRQPHLPRQRALPGAGLPGDLRSSSSRSPATSWASASTTRRRSSSPSSRRRPTTSTSCRSGPLVQEQTRDAPYFDTTSPNYGPPVAVGMGVAGGAYSGRVAVNAEQIDRLLAEAPDENIVLLRPDTVPEDIAMITRVERHPHGARRHHVARRRHREAPGQDGRGRVPGPRGAGARRASCGSPGTELRVGRLALHRRPHGQHLPGAHPHDRAAAAAASPLRAGGRSRPSGVRARPSKCAPA